MPRTGVGAVHLAAVDGEQPEVARRSATRRIGPLSVFTTRTRTGVPGAGRDGHVAREAVDGAAPVVDVHERDRVAPRSACAA